MSKDLPQFKTRSFDFVEDFIRDVLTTPGTSGLSSFRELITYQDGHYRAIFAADYFVIPAGQTEPSKSQWNGLKKKIKRHNPGVFVFKDHGSASSQADERRFYVDFGFFAERRDRT